MDHSAREEELVDFQDANLKATALKTPSVCQNERLTRDEGSSRSVSAVTNRYQPLRECTDAGDGVAGVHATDVVEVWSRSAATPLTNRMPSMKM